MCDICYRKPNVIVMANMQLFFLCVRQTHSYMYASAGNWNNINVGHAHPAFYWEACHLSTESSICTYRTLCIRLRINLWRWSNRSQWYKEKNRYSRNGSGNRQSKVTWQKPCTYEHDMESCRSTACINKYMRSNSIYAVSNVLSTGKNGSGKFHMQFLLNYGHTKWILNKDN